MMIRVSYRRAIVRATAGAVLMTGMLLSGQEAATDAPILSLADAIQIAVAHNRPVNIAKLEIAKSNWEVAQIKTKRFPAISTYLFASGDITNPMFTFPADLFDNKQPQQQKLSNGITGYAFVQVAQPLTQLYQIRLAIREQELSSDLASEQYQGQRQAVVASVKQAYYATLQTESALDAAQALVKQYEETDREATQYLSQEAVLKSDSLEAKAKLAQARYQIVQLRDTLATQKEQLNEILGRDLDVPFRT
jgi:outer membrane protein